MTINTVYIIEYCHGSPVNGDRRTTTRYSEDRYDSFMEGLEDLFKEGKVSYINTFKLNYNAGHAGHIFTPLMFKEKALARIQELNPLLA